MADPEKINVDQLAFWKGQGGHNWVARQEHTDITLAPGRPTVSGDCGLTLYHKLERDAFRLGHILHFGNSWHIHRV